MRPLNSRIVGVLALWIVLAMAQPTSAVEASEQVRAWNREAFARYEAGQTEQALDLFERAAAELDPSALYNVAVIRLRDESARPSLATAIEYLRASSVAGFAPAQYMLGTLLETGRHVGASQSEATVWFEKAAEQGVIDAQVSAATQYFLGRGVTRDYARAAHWYLRAAEAGDVAAQYLIASMYEHGTGVGQDLDQALSWYSAAARQGDIGAREQARAIAERLARDRRT